jgi:hypothetical protein
MVLSLRQLPVELRLKIFNQCTKRELVNVAVCSKFWCAEITPIIWKVVNSKNISRRFHLQRCEKEIEEKTVNLKYTQDLTFSVYGRSCVFREVIRKCDPNYLLSLRIVDVRDVRSGLESIPEMIPMLRELHLKRVKGVGVEVFSGLLELQVLSITHCRLNVDHLKTICLLPNLQTLELDGCVGLTGQCLDYIQGIVQLKQLVLNGTFNPGQFSAAILNLRNLIRLDFNVICLGNTTINDILFDHAERSFMSLESLNVGNSSITDISLVSISKLVNLRKLDLTNTDISDDGLSYLPSLSKLTDLWLSWCRNVTDKGCQHLSKLTSLKSLIMFDCRITDIGFQLITRLKNLQYLGIACISGITDVGFAFIAELKHLRRLDMLVTNVTNKSLEVIGDNLRFLEHLEIGQSHYFTNEGLHHLVKLNRLKKLIYHSIPGVTEDGLRNAGLDHLIQTV